MSPKKSLRDLTGQAGGVKKPRVVVGMSGGVDSSVAAALLKRAGFDVIGIFMKFWKEGKTGKNRCCSVESEKLARLVAKEIGIPFYVLNVEKEFKKAVVDYFVNEYKKGNTPNPCVVCNKEIKFGVFIKKALSLGADFVATGHYAKIINGILAKGEDKEKDQSYFLWQLNQKQLSHILFPLAGYKKPEVRVMAKKFKLPTAETPESQEVCFVDDTVNNFLAKYLKQKSGKIIDIGGKIVGKHNGLWFYTIGQRQGLGLQQGPWYVIGKDFRKNTLIVSKNQKDLLKKELIAGNVNWIAPVKLPGPKGYPVNVKIRYKSEFAKAKITKISKTKARVIFSKPQRAITPGQSVVFYKQNQLLGGGVIE